MEFMLTTAAADEVNWWLLKNDMSKKPMDICLKMDLLRKMEVGIYEFVHKLDIQFKESIAIPAKSLFTYQSHTKSVEWIEKTGPEVNRYCHFLNRVCEIRESICQGVRELEDRFGFGIEGWMIYEKQTNYWLRRAQSMGRFNQKPVFCQTKP